MCKSTRTVIRKFCKALKIVKLKQQFPKLVNLKTHSQTDWKVRYRNCRNSIRSNSKIPITIYSKIKISVGF